MAARRSPAQHHVVRRVATGASFALIASTMTGGALAVADEPVGGTESLVCADAAASVTDAAVMAASCGQDVEVVAQRTEWETTYATAEGNARLDVSSTAVRTAVNGVWEPIDTSVVADGSELRVAAPAFEMAFSNGSGDQPLARIVKDDHELTFDVPFDLTAPVVDGSRITYPQVLEGVDLVVSVHEDGTGFSEVLRVESPEAAANPALAELSFPVTTSTNLSVEQSDGGFEALDEVGERVFSSPTPLMWDSSTPTVEDAPLGVASRSGFFTLAYEPTDTDEAVAADRVAGPLVGDEVVAMPARVDRTTVTIVPDARLIDDPQTQWPVFIDPSISGGLHERTLIRSGNPNIVAGYNWTGNAGLGLCDPGTDSACSKWNDVHRLIFEYHGLSTIGSMAGSDVISATFSAYGAHSFSCTATGVEAHWVTGISAATTWNNYGNNFSSLLQARSVAHKPACSNARWIEFDVTRLLKGTADGNYSTAAIGLRASNEGSMAGSWKRYRGDATLSVTYNRAPNVPSSMSTSNPVTSCVTGAARPFIRSATPTLRVTVSDPDGGTLKGNFDIRRVSDNALVFRKSTTTLLTSGSTHTMPVPAGTLADNTTYKWWASGTDSSGRSGTAGACEFTVDMTRPGALPGVSAVAGQPGVYPENVVSGGVGQAGQFQFSNGGVSDVVSYKYSFNGDGLGQSVTVAAGGKVSFTPSAPGSQRLYVQSVDRAGNTSDVRLYRFSVDFPGMSGFWRLDEGSGSVAASATGSGNALGVSGSVQWVDGPLAEFGADALDRALRFDSSADVVASTGPVVNTNESYTVMAMVKLDSTASIYAAVSQDAQEVSGFKLGHRRDASCGTASGSCWAFWTANVDAAGPAPAKALADIEVRTGEWVHLTGVHDAQSDELRLYVCPVGTPEAPGEQAPQLAGTASFATPTWSAGGALQVGRGRSSSAPADFWPGVIDDVRVYDAAVSVVEIRDACQKQS